MSIINKLKLFFLFGLMAASNWLGAETLSIQLSKQQVDSLNIKMGKLEPTSHVPLFTAPAKVVVPPAKDFIVSTNQAGLVVKMNASVGDMVNKGDVMGLINSPDLLSLQGNYLKALGKLKLATAAYRREQKLLKEGVVSGRSEQEAYSQYNTSAISVNEARQLLQIAGLTAAEIKQLDSDGRLVSQLRIRSPVTGQVIERMVVSGTHVDQMTSLYRVANLDELWLEINIPQAYIDEVKIGDKIQVENSLAEAEIRVLGQSVNPENQTVQARAVIKANSASVRIGQKLTIQHFQSSDAITYKLPDGAIAHHDGKTYVFIRDKAGFKVNEVTILGKQADGSVLTGNFTGDEEIAVNNAVALKAHWLGFGSGE